MSTGPLAVSYTHLWDTCNECGEKLVSDEEYKKIEEQREKIRIEEIKNEYKKNNIQFTDKEYQEIKNRERSLENAYYNYKLRAELDKREEENQNSCYCPKCPTCNSPNIKKLKASDKVGSVLALGLFSRKLGKQFKCCLLYTSRCV